MKKGFTLAEAMIVLAIIGALMAILVPILDNASPDETTIKYRKTFFSIEQAVRYILSDEKLYKTGDLRYPVGPLEDQEELNQDGYFDDTTANNRQGRKLCYNLANVLNTIGEIKCPGDNGLSSLELGNGQSNQLDDGDEAAAVTSANANMVANNVNFTLSNGVSVGGITGKWNITDDNSQPQKTAFITLCVDVNGISKGPNVGCATNDRANLQRDQFRIRIARDGKVYTGSAAGRNNWYQENIMLINPGAITRNSYTWSTTESERLTESQGNQAINLTTQNQCTMPGYKWDSEASVCVFTAKESYTSSSSSSSSSSKKSNNDNDNNKPSTSK